MTVNTSYLSRLANSCWPDTRTVFFLSEEIGGGRSPADALRSQRFNVREAQAKATGNEEDSHFSGICERKFEKAKANHRVDLEIVGRSIVFCMKPVKPFWNKKYDDTGTDEAEVWNDTARSHRPELGSARTALVNAARPRFVHAE